MPKDAFYFSHDYHARNDDKILELRVAYGAEGYGVFWMIVETMAESDNGGINNSLVGGLSLGFGVAKDRLQEIITYCLSVNLLYEEGGFIYSRRIMKHRDWRKSLSDAGKKGADNKYIYSPPKAPLMANINKIKENNNKEYYVEDITQNQKKVKFQIKHLGNIEIYFFTDCERWEIKELFHFITTSQSEFEKIAMTKPFVKTTENFQIALQEFVDGIQQKREYEECPRILGHFVNWLNSQNGSLEKIIQNKKQPQQKTKVDAKKMAEKYQ